MKTKYMILLTAALCGFALAPVAMSQPAGDPFTDAKVPAARPAKEFVIKVLANGKVLARGETIELAALDPILKEIAPEISKRPVRLVGDSSLPYQRMVDVIEACRKAGIWNIAMGQTQGDAPADPNADKDKTEEIVLTLQRDGRVKMDHEVMAATEFEVRARELGKRFSRPHLRIVTDGTAPADLAAKVMEIIQKERLEAPALSKISSDLLVRYEVFSIDLGTAAAMRREKPTDGKFYADLVSLVEKGDADQQSLMVTRCASGQKAKTVGVTRETYPTEWDPQPAGTLPGAQGENPPKVVVPVRAEAFENRDAGEELEVEPIRGENSKHIELKIIATHTSFAERTPWGKDTSLTEMPLFETQRVTTNAHLTEGEPFLLSTMNPPPGSKVHPGRIWFAFATVSFAD